MKEVSENLFFKNSLWSFYFLIFSIPMVMKFFTENCVISDFIKNFRGVPDHFKKLKEFDFLRPKPWNCKQKSLKYFIRYFSHKYCAAEPLMWMFPRYKLAYQNIIRRTWCTAGWWFSVLFLYSWHLVGWCCAGVSRYTDNS